MRLSLITLCLVVSTTLFAQNFSPHYKVAMNFYPYGKAEQLPNGNILLYGKIDYLNGLYYGRLICISASGERVASFNTVFADGQVNDVLSLSDGKILISGDFTKINGQAVKQPVRLNADGSIDATFNSTLANVVYDMAAQKSGKIIVNHNGNLARLNSNGSTDNTFSNTIYVPESAVLATGSLDEVYYATYSGTTTRVLKLAADGTPDNTFTTGTGSSNGNYLQSVVVQPDGKILVASDFATYDGFASKAIVRLLPGGQIDQTFNAGDKINGTIHTIVLQGDKIVVAGNISQYGNQQASVVELNSDGSLSKVIAVADHMVHSMFTTADNRLMLMGEFKTLNSRPGLHLARFNADGTLDQTLKANVFGANRLIGEIRVDAENRPIVVASSYSLDGAFLNTKKVGAAIVRVNFLGDPDKTYAASVPANSMIFGHDIGSDNKLLLCGPVTFGQSLIRFNANGTPDLSLTSLPLTKGSAQTFAYMVKQIGSTIYLGGDFTSYGAFSSRSIVALKSDGTVNETFSSTLPENSEVRQVLTQSDGKILLRGQFPHASGTQHLVRLNADGTRDNTFQTPTFNVAPTDVSVDESDNIYVVGLYLFPNGSARETAARLFPNGALDPSFNIDNLFTTDFLFLRSVEALPGGRVAVGGAFKNLGGQEISGFALLDANGAIVPYSTTLGRNSEVQDMQYANNAVFVLGQFFSKDHTETFGIMKFLLNPILPAAPANATATVQNDGDLTLTWTHTGADVSAFVVEKSSGSGSTFLAIDTVSHTTRSIPDKVEREVTYQYRVRALNDSGFSDYSNVMSITWSPAPVGSLTLTGENDGTNAVLTWTANLKYHDGIKVERAASANGEFLAILTTETDNSFSDPLTEGETKVYRVSAFNDSGSISSNHVTVVITGIHGERRTIQLYPNPSTNSVTLKGINTSEELYLTMIASDGKVFHPDAQAVSDDEVSFDISKIPVGLYILDYKVGKIRFTSKIVKK